MMQLKEFQRLLMEKKEVYCNDFNVINFFFLIIVYQQEITHCGGYYSWIKNDKEKFCMNFNI